MMSETIILELPENLAHSIKAFAEHSHRRLEDVLVEWIDHAASELPLEALSDNQILNLCDIQMTEAQQQQLSELLARNREGVLPVEERASLDNLMHIYRQGLVRKSQALKIAVGRGLRPPLDA